MKRVPNGRINPQLNVVPADLIGALAGVAFGSVIKIMYAINTISKKRNISFDDLLELEHIPTELAEGDRRRTTEEAVITLIDEIGVGDTIRARTTRNWARRR